MAVVRCQHCAWLVSAASVHLVASKWQRLTKSAFCLPTFHPLLPPRHTGGWLPGKLKPIFSDVTRQASRAGLAPPPPPPRGLAWGPLIITPKTAEMVAWSRDCRKTARDQSLCQPGSLPMVRLWCSHSYKATIVKVFYPHQST